VTNKLLAPNTQIMVTISSAVSPGFSLKLQAVYHASHSPLMSDLCLRFHAALWIWLYFSSACFGLMFPFQWSLLRLVPPGCIYLLVRNFSDWLWKSHWLFGFYLWSLSNNQIQFCKTTVPNHSGIHQYHIVRANNTTCIAIGRCLQVQHNRNDFLYVVLEVSATASEKLKQVPCVPNVAKATENEAKTFIDEINKLIEQDLEQSCRSILTRYFRPAADAAAAPSQASGFFQCIRANFKSPIEKGFIYQALFMALAFVGWPYFVAWWMEYKFHFSTIKVGLVESTRSSKCMYANSMHASCNEISSKPFYEFLFYGLGKNIGLGYMEFDTFVSRLDKARWICNFCLGEFLSSVFVIGFNLFNPKKGNAD